MRRRGNRSRRRTRNSGSIRIWLFALLILGDLAAVGVGLHAMCFLSEEQKTISPEELLISYMGHIERAEYEEMYAMLNIETSGNISEDEFIKHNSAIYEGIGMQNMTVAVIGYGEERESISYETSFDTSAGPVSFANEAFFLEGEEGYVQNVTAEIKASQTDTTGTELGWFAVFTPEADTDRPVLLLTMVEDVKERGGSGYVVERSSRVLDAWFQEP